jgi:hypothetical protein
MQTRATVQAARRNCVRLPHLHAISSVCVHHVRMGLNHNAMLQGLDQAAEVLVGGGGGGENGGGGGATPYPREDEPQVTHGGTRHEVNACAHSTRLTSLRRMRVVEVRSPRNSGCPGTPSAHKMSNTT